METIAAKHEEPEEAPVEITDEMRAAAAAPWADRGKHRRTGASGGAVEEAAVGDCEEDDGGAVAETLR